MVTSGVRTALLVACLLTVSEQQQQQQQRPSSDPTFGSMLAKARFGQGRPFNHFGRRRVAPPAPAASAAVVPPAAAGAVEQAAVSVAPSPLPPPALPVAAPNRREHAAASGPRVDSDADRRAGGDGAIEKPVNAPRTALTGKPQPAVGRNDALRGVETGSFVVAGDGENAANRQPATASGFSKINMETKLSTSAVSGIQTESVRVGGTAILHCTFDERERPAVHQPAQIWWTKLPSRSSDRAVVLASGSQVRFPDERLKVVAFPDALFSVLIIRAAVEEDAAEYKCSLPTVTGYKTAFAKLEVKESLESQIATSESANLVKAGDDHALFCKSKSGLPLSVWWSAKTSDGRAMNVLGAEERVYGETLSLTSVSKDMEGVYTCHVESKEGSPIRKHFSLALKERPWEIVAYQSGLRADALLWQAAERAIPYGEAVDLRCDSGGAPKPTVRWLRNGQPLPELGPYHTIASYDSAYKSNAVVSKLTIASFAPSEAGRYTCAVENDAGYREHTFDLRARSQEANEI